MPFRLQGHALKKTAPIGAVFLFLTGLFVEAEAPETSGIAFSHMEHQSQGIECEGCHTKTETSESGADNLLPGKSTCAECHDVEEQSECRDCHVDPESARAMEPIVDYNPKFNHSTHPRSSIECDRCHEGVAASESSSTTHLPSMDPCMVCHDGESAARSCITCHEKPEGKYPADHVPKEWIADHVFDFSLDMGESCKTCHTTEQCQRCHLDRVLLKP